MVEYLALMDGEEGWATECSKNGLTVKYKAGAGQTISLKVEGIIRAPIFNFVTLVNEPDCFASWVPFCKSAASMKQVHRCCKTANVRLGLPFPMADREGFFVGNGVDRLGKNGTILILSNSFDEDPKFMKRHGIVIPESGKNVRMYQKYLGFEIMPITYDELKVRVVTNVDIKMKFLPVSILNWFNRKLALGLFENLTAVARKFKGSAFERYVNDKEKIAYYTWLKKKFDDYLASKNIGQIKQ